MAYIPSWADNPTFQKGFQGFLQNLIAGVAPDFTARQRFQDLAAQDPTLIETISNMDDGSRETYSKEVLGAKNKNPLAKIGIGPKRAERERIAAARASLNPQQAAKSIATELGTKTPEELARESVLQGREDQLFPLQLEGAQVDLKGKRQKLESGDLELQQAKESEEKRRKLLEAIPDVDQNQLREYADSIVFRRQFKGDPNFAARVQSDQLLSPILKQYIDAASDRLRISAQRDIAELKTPQEKMWGFQFFKDAADNARLDRDKKQEVINKMGVAGPMLNPEAYAQAQADLAAAQKNYKTMNNAYIDYGKSKLGVSVESPEDQVAAQIAQAIISGQGTLQEFEAQNRNPTMLEKVKKILQGSTGFTPKSSSPPAGSLTNQFPTFKR